MSELAKFGLGVLGLVAIMVVASSPDMLAVVVVIAAVWLGVLAWFRFSPGRRNKPGA